MTPPGPRLAAFAHPELFWAGLALVAVPILIHLFFRRRHRVVRWAAMDFLLAALKKQKRRIELENLILLLLRCAAVLLLAVAVARPAVPAPELPFGGSARAVVLVIDSSTSMGTLHTGRSALDRAKEQAAQFLAELPEGSQVTLVATRDDQALGMPRAILENADSDGARAALAGVRLAHGPNRLGPVFQLVAEKLALLRGRRLVVFLTDFQRRDWYGGDPYGRLEDVFRALRGLDPTDVEERTPVVLVDAGRGDAGNVVVADLSVDAGRLAFAGKLLDVTASLLNYGPSPARGTITLQLARPDGSWEKVLAEEVTVPAALGLGQPEPLERQFLPRVPARGDGSARFRAVFTPRAESADADRLPADSERFLALRVRPPVRILPVRTFRYALELLEDVELLEVIDLLPPIYPPDIGAYDLSGVDVVLWADAEMTSLTPEDAARIGAFVRDGGALLAYLGLQTDEATVNRLFRDGSAGPLLPMRLGTVRIDEEQPVEIELDDEHLQRHPLFKEMSRPFFFSPEFTHYRRASDHAEAAVVARYTNGDPAVLEHAYGRGRVVAVTTAPDGRCFRLNGSLVPAAFFYNAAQYLVWEPPRLRNVTVGEPVPVPLPPGTREVEVTPPLGGTTQEPLHEGAREFQLHDTAVPGFYRVVARGVVAGTTALPTESTVDIAANLDAGEGDLRRVTREQLRHDYQGVPFHFAEEAEAILPRGAQGDTGEASRALLGGVVGILLLELVCAWRFGCRRRPAA